MWCVGVLTQEYRLRMYDLLDLYARPWSAREPVICVDEKSKQLLLDSRAHLPMVAGKPLRRDYEYVRTGTCNVFVAVEPLGGRRITQVTDHRGKAEFVAFAKHLIDTVYRSARRIHLVVDNLSTHFRSCFVDTLGERATRMLLRRVVFHYTPKHGSWLNMAEIEIAALGRQCLNRRIGDQKLLAREVAAWQRRRNSEHRTIQWTFTRQDADRKLGRHYVSNLTC
jgi:DDE superfamily endonuclease